MKGPAFNWRTSRSLLWQYTDLDFIGPCGAVGSGGRFILSVWWVGQVVSTYCLIGAKDYSKFRRAKMIDGVDVPCWKMVSYWQVKLKRINCFLSCFKTSGSLNRNQKLGHWIFVLKTMDRIVGLNNENSYSMMCGVHYKYSYGRAVGLEEGISDNQKQNGHIMRFYTGVTSDNVHSLPTSRSCELTSWSRRTGDSNFRYLTETYVLMML